MITTVFVHSLRRVLSLLVVLTTGAACGLPGNSSLDGRPGETAMLSRRGHLERRLVLTGTLEAVENTMVQVPQTTEQRITLQWLAPDGSEVRQGDPIAEFDSSPFSLALESGQNQVLVAKRTLNRLKKQADADAEESEILQERAQATFAKAELDAKAPPDLRSRQEYEKAQLALEQAHTALLKSEEDRTAQRSASATRIKTQEQDLITARRELQRAEEAVSVVRLKAPTDGILVIADHPWEGRRVQVGDTLWTGLAVAKVPDLSHMRVRAILWDVDDGALTTGMKARCTLDAVPDRHFGGRVADITPVAQEARRFSLRRGFNVVIDLDMVDPEVARPGMSIHVDIALPGPDGAVLIPRSCLIFDGAKTFVSLGDGTRREVSLGPCSAQECVVDSGLEAGVELRRS